MVSVVHTYGNPDFVYAQGVFENFGYDPVQITQTSTFASWDFGIYRGTKTENFNKRRRRGDLLPHQSYKRFDTHCAATASCEYTTDMGQGPFLKRYSRIDYGSENLILNESSMRDIALENAGTDPHYYLQAAAAKVWDGFDFGTFVAEINSTLDLVVDAIKRFYILFKKAKAFKLTPQDAMKTWLEWRYGWRTLIYDIISIDKAAKQNYIFQILTEKVGQDDVIHNTFEHTLIGGLTTVSWTVYDTISLGLRGSFAAKINRLRAFINPAVTAWELIPFSFVVDWFISIGQFLKALSTQALGVQQTGSIGIEVICHRRTDPVADVVVHDPQKFVSGVFKHYFTQDCTFRERTPSTVSSKPFFKMNLDLYKIFDLISLILGGKPKSGVQI